MREFKIVIPPIDYRQIHRIDTETIDKCKRTIIGLKARNTILENEIIKLKQQIKSK
jgi:hypothetical protein